MDQNNTKEARIHYYHTRDASLTSSTIVIAVHFMEWNPKKWRANIAVVHPGMSPDEAAYWVRKRGARVEAKIAKAIWEDLILEDYES